MSYEVYIDVRHHPKHCDNWEKRERTAFKFTDLPEGTDELIYVVNGLREFADELDPRVRCTRCGEVRGPHLRLSILNPGLDQHHAGMTHHPASRLAPGHLIHPSLGSVLYPPSDFTPGMATY